MFGGGIPLDKYSRERNLDGLKTFLQEHAGTNEEEREEEKGRTEEGDSEERKEEQVMAVGEDNEIEQIKEEDNKV